MKNILHFYSICEIFFSIHEIYIFRSLTLMIFLFWFRTYPKSKKTVLETNPVGTLDGRAVFEPSQLKRSSGENPIQRRPWLTRSDSRPNPKMVSSDENESNEPGMKYLSELRFTNLNCHSFIFDQFLLLQNPTRLAWSG